MSAHYWIAKYIPDVFRNEPKNVGVIVQNQSTIAARFLGETDSGEIDGRKLRRVSPHQDVYRQWIMFWRRKIADLAIKSILEANTSNFGVNEGGIVSDVGNDSAEEIASYLYALLVSESPVHEVLVQEDETEVERPAALAVEIASQLRNLQLLAEDREALFLPRYPILRNVVVHGRRVATHTPTFVQRNGNLCVMEPVDFASPQKRRARDHAGWVASMFRDIQLAETNSETIGLVRIHPQDEENENVKSGLGLLEADATRIINWSVDTERQSFLEERKRIAEHQQSQQHEEITFFSSSSD